MHVVVIAILSGIFAGIVAVLATVCIEKFGGSVGSILATLPTTIIPASLGVAYEAAHPTDTDASGEPQADAAGAMLAVPAGMLVNAAFLQCWRVIPPRLSSRGLRPRGVLSATVTISLTVWLLLAGLFVAGTRSALRAERWWIAWGSLASLLTAGALATIAPEAKPPAVSDAHGDGERGMRGGMRGSANNTGDSGNSGYSGNSGNSGNSGAPPQGPVAVPTFWKLVPRGVMAGAAVFASVLAGSVNASAAGMAAIFPAIFLTTMVSLWLAHGDAVPLGAAGPMMLGSASVAIYAVVFAAMLGPSGSIWLAFLLAYAVAALGYSLPVGWCLARRDAKRRERADVDRLEGELLSISHTGLIDDDDDDEIELEL